MTVMPTYDELLREVRELRAEAAIDVDRINKLALHLIWPTRR
jgi:hypothetical protein